MGLNNLQLYKIIIKSIIKFPIELTYTGRIQISPHMGAIIRKSKRSMHAYDQVWPVVRRLKCKCTQHMSAYVCPLRLGTRALKRTNPKQGAWGAVGKVIY